MSAAESRIVTYRHLAFILGCVWLGMVLYALLRHVSGMLTFRDYDSDPLNVIRYATLYFWLPWFAFAPLVALLSKRLPIRPESWVWPLCANTLLFLAIIAVHSLGIAYYYHYLGDVSPEMAGYAPWQHSGHFMFGDNMFSFELITYAVLAANLNMGNFHHIVRRQELDAARMRETLAELRLQTLRMQINPHFLFNALNAVTVLVQKNEPARAVEMINRIASFFRGTLEDTNWIPLERELEMATEYIAIAKVRYGNRLRVEEECDPALRTVPIPAMLLQPLIENAVTHGIAEKSGECRLALRCRNVQGRLVIEISDDGAGCALDADPDFREGIGLRNVRLRLRQLYAEDHAFSIESKPGEGTRVTISVPMLAPVMPQAVAV